jgi:hypothetical protein
MWDKPAGKIVQVRKNKAFRRVLMEKYVDVAGAQHKTIAIRKRFAFGP